MNTRNESSPKDAEAIRDAVADRLMSSQATDRRRMLLRGIGKGTAVLAATVPLKTLAGQTLLTYDSAHACSISGMHSGVHSTTPSTPTCSGYAPTWWGQPTNNTPPTPANKWPLSGGITFNTACKDVFTKSTISVSLFKVMNLPAYANTDERHWICAWLNAQFDDLTNAGKFPYTGAEVLNFYKSSGATYADALTFFKGFMETRTV